MLLLPARWYQELRFIIREITMKSQSSTAGLSIMRAAQVEEVPQKPRHLHPCSNHILLPITTPSHTTALHIQRWQWWPRGWTPRQCTCALGRGHLAQGAQGSAISNMVIVFQKIHQSCVSCTRTSQHVCQGFGQVQGDIQACMELVGCSITHSSCLGHNVGSTSRRHRSAAHPGGRSAAHHKQCHVCVNAMAAGHRRREETA